MNTASGAVVGRQLARFGRPQNALYPGLLAAGVALLGGASLLGAIACVPLLFCLYALAAGYNNLQDVATDRLNKRRDNPLVAGQVPKFARIAFFIANSSVVLLLQLALAQPASLALSASWLLLAYAYSSPRLRLQARSWLAPVVLGACYGALPLVIGAAQGWPLAGQAVLLLAVLQIFLLAPTLLAKDYKDATGDRATGKRTPLVRHGAKMVGLVAVSMALVTAAGYASVTVYLGGPLALATTAGAVYLAFCSLLHSRRGNISPPLRKAGSALLLCMSLYLYTLTR